MGMFRFFLLILWIVSLNCKRVEDPIPEGEGMDAASQAFGKVEIIEYNESAGKGALLLTRFSSLEEFKQMVQIHYAADLKSSPGDSAGNQAVELTYSSGGRQIRSILKSGISQADFMAARAGNFWDKVQLGLKSPYAVVHRKDLVHIENLGRRRPWVNGQGDVAFYDLAETMVWNILPEDTLTMSRKDLSEKGYLNTFNHITAQTFMTALYSERLADFVADVHELHNMPELISGTFSEEQLADFDNGPVDNYIDMINNEWGQELGKRLREKYSICRHMIWTPVLVADLLNEIQSYQAWAFQIGFKPFRPTDEMVIRFANKINSGL